MSKIKQLLNKTTNGLKKHSPAILTGVGIVGLGVTAYLAYKSRDKVEEVVEYIEDCREQEVEVDKVIVAKNLADALYLPVVVGAVSVTAIFASYRIQNRRIKSLAGALLAQQAHNAFMEKKYRQVHGDEEFNKFMAPVETVETETVDAKGKVKKMTEENLVELDKTIGEWYKNSTEYVRDDHHYNMAYIQSIDERLQTLLFQRGTLLLNEVREALGLERIRAGALLGWSAADYFNIDTAVVNHVDENGEPIKEIWVTWSKPSYIHDKVEFNGRYSIHG